VAENLTKYTMILTIPRIKKWKNIVKVYAAESCENTNELTYVKGKMPKGNTK
jgi:hypothetical protein